MSYIITNVPSYKVWNKDGVVVDQMTDKPREFAFRENAERFCQLSHYSGHVKEMR